MILRNLEILCDLGKSYDSGKCNEFGKSCDFGKSYDVGKSCDFGKTYDVGDLMISKIF